MMTRNQHNDDNDNDIDDGYIPITVIKEIMMMTATTTTITTTHNNDNKTLGKEQYIDKHNY